jgi:hypothetical protein
MLAGPDTTSASPTPEFAMKRILRAIGMLVLIAACSEGNATGPERRDASLGLGKVRRASPPLCYEYQTNDPGWPGSYDGTMDINCNAEALAIGILSVQWASGWNDRIYGTYNGNGTNPLMLFASTNCGWNSTQNFPYGYRVELNDNTVFSGQFDRLACDPLQ